MKFKNEVGAIIASDEGLITMFDGQPGSVDFPDELIQKVHRLSPGYINRFTHTHPPGMNKPSNQDNTMMTNLAFSMYPFPARLGIIVPNKTLDLMGRPADSNCFFIEHVYQWVLEPKEIWKEKKIENDIERAIVYKRVKSRMIKYQVDTQSWQDWIIERSYHG